MQKTVSIVSLENIRRNAKIIRERLGGRKFFAVVKADAYGHGAERVSLAVQDIVDGYCVAIFEEGISLRTAGIIKPVLVLTPPLDGYDVLRAEHYDLLCTVNSAETARSIHGLPCHIKVNTGMNRYGCEERETDDILSCLKREQVQGVYSHLYEPSDGSASAAQLEIFDRAEKKVKAFNPDACAHIAASGGIMLGGKYLKDGARCGLLLYGYSPTGFDRITEPALKVYARLAQSTRFIGGGAGYGRAQREYGRLFTYRAGYADGFRRGVPLGENKLCMDAFIRDGGGETVCVMDDADEYAKRAGTISYEVLTSVTRRTEFVYI